MDFQIILASLLAVVLLIMLFTVKKRYLLINALIGIAVLVMVNVASIFTGVGLGFGLYTVLSTLVLGVPAVAAMILVNLI